MDNTALVNLDIERGAELLEILERAKLKVYVALWMSSSDYQDWRLVVSARGFEGLGPREAYRLLNDTLDAAGFGIEKTPPVLLLPLNDPFIKALRRSFSKAKSVEGMRLGGQLIGDRFVHDAYVYRIA